MPAGTRSTNRPARAGRWPARTRPQIAPRARLPRCPPRPPRRTPPPRPVHPTVSRTEVAMKTLLPLLVCLLLLAAPARAQTVVPGCIEIASVPYTISAPGTYCLTQSFEVDITSGATITINSTQVNLDCREHSLYNVSIALNGSSSAIYLANRHDVTIRNCRIFGGYTHGIN